MTINIDFDGTCVTHEFQEVGKNIGAEIVLKELTDLGHQLILFTMRSDSDRPYLTEAVDWFNQNEIPLYGIQTNPTQSTWTESPKSYAELMIDDSALGCPLTQKPLLFDKKSFLHLYGESDLLRDIDDNFCLYTPKRKYVNWLKINELLLSNVIIDLKTFLKIKKQLLKNYA